MVLNTCLYAKYSQDYQVNTSFFYLPSYLPTFLIV